MPHPPSRRLALGLAIAGLLGLGAAPRADRLAGVSSWAAFYGAEAPMEALQRPDVLVLEPGHPWRPEKVRREGQRILAYLSLGEVDRSRPYFSRLEAAGALAGANPNWPNAVRLDPRSGFWRALVLDELAPEMLKAGYDGFFLDTLDVGPYLEGQGLAGARRAMIRLVGELHARYPKALLVANGGLGLLPEAAPSLSAIAVESVLTDYDFARSRYRERGPSEALARSRELLAVGERTGLPLLVLEYVDPQDALARRQAAEAARALGFVPFVSDIGLTRLETP